MYKYNSTIYIISILNIYIYYKMSRSGWVLIWPAEFAGGGRVFLGGEWQRQGPIHRGSWPRNLGQRNMKEHISLIDF